PIRLLFQSPRVPYPAVLARGPGGSRLWSLLCVEAIGRACGWHSGAGRQAGLAMVPAPCVDHKGYLRIEPCWHKILLTVGRTRHLESHRGEDADESVEGRPSCQGGLEIAWVGHPPRSGVRAAAVPCRPARRGWPG